MNIMSDLVSTEDSPLALLTAAVFPCSLNLCLIYTDLGEGDQRRGEEREMETRSKRKRERWGHRGGDIERKRNS